MLAAALVPEEKRVFSRSDALRPAEDGGITRFLISFAITGHAMPDQESDKLRNEVKEKAPLVLFALFNLELDSESRLDHTQFNTVVEVEHFAGNRARNGLAKVTVSGSGFAEAFCRQVRKGSRIGFRKTALPDSSQNWGIDFYQFEWAPSSLICPPWPRA